ncbi:MAG: hypothetical protein AAB617_00135 [Patescibacteria group bacterium]
MTKRASFALRGLKFMEFADIFKENLTRRSRTAKGISDTSSSSSKKPLLKSGEDLRRQVEENTLFLITNAWDRGQNQPSDPTAMRQMMELWYDIINKDLQNPDAYKETFSELEAEAGRLSGETGKPWKVNHRYRTWTISYTSLNLKPIDLEFAMESFYRTLFEKIRRAESGQLSQAELLAFADHMIDGQIHPWAGTDAEDAQPLP